MKVTFDYPLQKHNHSINIRTVSPGKRFSFSNSIPSDWSYQKSSVQCMLLYSHLSNNREVMLTDFEKKNLPSTHISTLHAY